MNKTFSVTVDFDQLVEDHDRNGNIGYLYLRECYKRLEVTAFLKKYQLNAELFAFFVYTDVIDDLQNLQEIYDYRRHYLHGPQFTTDDLGELEYGFIEHRKEYLMILQKRMIVLYPKSKDNIIKVFKEYRRASDLLPLLEITKRCVITVLYEDLNKGSYYFNNAQLRTTLRDMSVININDQYYQAGYENSYVLKALEDTYHLGLDKRYYTIEEMQAKLKR